MKENKVPPQSAPCLHTGHEDEREPSRAPVDASLRRRRLLQLLGAGALGLAVPSLGQNACLAAAESSVPDSLPPEAPFWEPAGMDVMTAIFTRRTQREYTGEPVPKDVIQRILAAGMNAPSAHNTQPWSFVVITSQETLNHIPKLIPYSQYAVKAGAAIITCVRFLEGEIRELALMSTACCMQNMLLTSHALGYGSVWMHIYPNQDFIAGWRKELKIPEDILPLAVLPVGKPLTALSPVSRMDPTKVRYESW